MRTLKFTYWRDSEYFLGYLNDYPDYETQGFSKEELEGNLKSLLDHIESGENLGQGEVLSRATG